HGNDQTAKNAGVQSLIYIGNIGPVDANLDGQQYRSDRPGPHDSDYRGPQQCPKIVTEVARHIRQSIDAGADLLREWSAEVPQHTPCVPEQKNHSGNNGCHEDLDIDGLRVDQGDGSPHKQLKTCQIPQSRMPQVFPLCRSSQPYLRTTRQLYPNLQQPQQNKAPGAYFFFVIHTQELQGYAIAGMPREGANSPGFT